MQKTAPLNYSSRIRGKVVGEGNHRQWYKTDFQVMFHQEQMKNNHKYSNNARPPGFL